MVCNRCKLAVKSELEKLGLHALSVELGEVEILETNFETKKIALAQNLKSLGFELIDDKKSVLIERIKNLIVLLVHEQKNDIKTNLSDYLSDQLSYDYQILSTLFSSVENNTIENYFIVQRIEKVKELIMYDELNFSEIAFYMKFSNVAHLSAQFKKVTGFTPSYFKQLKNKKRKQIDEL
jgi:AraC-like DNA-binding protein